MTNDPLLQAKKLSDSVFDQLSRFIDRQIGIKMPPAKRVMLESRLQKRLRALSMDSFEDYWGYLQDSSNHSTELVELINAVTTNKTDFFREPDHYAFLSDQVLPSFLGDTRTAGRPFRIWSAGCSSGEEPHTMAIVLEEFRQKHSSFTFAVDATDISMKVLNMARAGIYEREKIEGLPLSVKKQYFLKGKGQKLNKVRVKPFLSENITFFPFNLMEDSYPHKEWYDVVFCRNVLIYFERSRQEMIIRKLIGSLRKDGYLFLGHSESITGMDLPLDTLQSTVYRKRAG